MSTSKYIILAIIIIFGLYIGGAILSGVSSGFRTIGNVNNDSSSPRSDDVGYRDVGEELRDVRREVQDLEEEVEELERKRNASTWSKYVSLSRGSVSPVDPQEEYLKIRVSGRAPFPINITDWVLKSEETKQYADIPRGTELLETEEGSAVSDIYLDPGMTAYVVSGRAPIKISFRTNICTGYLDESRSYNPSLRHQCPDLEDEALEDFDISYNDEECIDYLEDVRECREVEDRSRPDGISGKCYLFAREYSTYDGCIRLHKNDLDFYEDEWRIFLGERFDLWRSKRDHIRLLDNEGGVVDEVIY